jgi:hypothetical protein
LAALVLCRDRISFADLRSPPLIVGLACSMQVVSTQCGCTAPLRE